MNADNLKKEIKKIKVWHVALLCTGVFLAFAIIGSILLVAGGGLNWGNMVHFGDYGNIGPGEIYEVNDLKELDLDGVSKIEIKTISDEAILISGGDKVVAELKGQCRSVSGPKWLDARKQGGTMIIEIKYPQTVNSSNTRLTVTIPAQYAGDLSVSTISGGVRAAGLPNKLGRVNMHTTSGSVDFSAASYSEMKAGSVSGEITITGIAARTTVNTTSGGIHLDYTAFVATNVTTVSGGVTAAIPQSAAFKVDFGSVSGVFTANHPDLGIDRAKGGFSGSTPDGKELFKVSTTSGNFKIDGK